MRSTTIPIRRRIEFVADLLPDRRLRAHRRGVSPYWLATGIGTGLSDRRCEAKAREALMKRWFVGCCIAVIAGPAVSQPKKAEAAFYVVFNTLTKQCSVVDKPPKTDTPNITVASDTIYDTRTEADAAARTLKPCMP
jgi:hypothetical protein